MHLSYHYHLHQFLPSFDIFSCKSFALPNRGSGIRYRIKAMGKPFLCTFLSLLWSFLQVLSFVSFLLRFLQISSRFQCAHTLMQLAMMFYLSRLLYWRKWSHDLTIILLHRCVLSTMRKTMVYSRTFLWTDTYRLSWCPLPEMCGMWDRGGEGAQRRTEEQHSLSFY